MRVTQIRNSSNSIAASLKTTGFKQLLAVGSVAIGIAAIIPAAPAQAASLAGGSLNFTGFTSDFYFDPGTAPANLSVNFNLNSALTTVGTATGPFASAVPPATYSNPLQTANLSQVNAAINPLRYKLNNQLVFNFGNGTTFTLNANSRFTGVYNTDLDDNILGMTFNLTTNAGSFYTNNGTVTNTNTLAFSFNDVPGATGGTYGVVSTTSATPPTSVPEPFSIIGTLVGGTAAFRMRKKLSDVAKK